MNSGLACVAFDHNLIVEKHHPDLPRLPPVIIASHKKEPFDDDFGVRRLLLLLLLLLLLPLPASLLPLPALARARG